MNDWIIPEWPAPARVKALFTTRKGGVSSVPYASLNLGDHVGDDPSRVEQNRTLLRRFLPEDPSWLKQTHGTTVIDAGAWRLKTAEGAPEGDAVFTRQSANVCAILVADCLPILFCDRNGTIVGLMHAGWRGLAAGIVQRTLSAIDHRDSPLMAWLGPAIGPGRFEVGEEVRNTFIQRDSKSARAFARPPEAGDNAGKWLANIFLLAQQQLMDAGITEIHGGGVCTYNDPDRFFSYRRDGVTGRMAGLIWLA